MRIHRLLPIVALALAAPGARAANEIVNGDFDVDVSGWIGNAAFDPLLDVDGDLASGSLRVANVNPGTGTEARQSIPVTPGVPIRAEFQVYLAAGQDGVGYAYPGVNFFEGECGSGGAYLSSVNAQLVSGPFNAWSASVMPETITPATARCADVVLFVRNDGDAGTFAASFDAIFAPEPGAVAAAIASLAALAAAHARRAAR
jgi:hypothetical protein